MRVGLAVLLVLLVVRSDGKPAFMHPVKRDPVCHAIATPIMSMSQAMYRFDCPQGDPDPNVIFFSSSFFLLLLLVLFLFFFLFVPQTGLDVCMRVHTVARRDSSVAFGTVRTSL